MFDGATRFVTVDYQRDWSPVREVAKSSGTSYDAVTYDKLTAMAAANGKKKSEE